MTLLKTRPEGVTGEPEPVTLQGRAINVPRDIITRPCRGIPVDSLSTLWPEAHFRSEMVKAAKLFVSDMEKKGFLLLTPETSIKVFGPYHPRGRYAQPGDRIDPEQGTGLAQGRQDGEDAFAGLADFVIEAQFIAPRGHVTVGLDGQE